MLNEFDKNPRQTLVKVAIIGVGISGFGAAYAKTLREWLNRFDAAEHKIRALGYGDEFMRSWRFYLQICAATFQNNNRTNVMHVELRHA